MIDLKKNYRTRDGRSVKLICNDLSGEYPVLGIVTGPNGIREDSTWTLEGRHYTERDAGVRDLIEVPPAWYLNVYKDGDGWVVREHPTKEDADTYAGTKRISRIKIDLVEGRFDD